MGNALNISIPEDLTCVRMTSQEKEELDAMLSKLDYRCGDDGWIPTLQDVDEKLIGRYHAKVREKLELASKSTPDRKKMTECDAELKRLWIFMYWIADTCLDMEPTAYLKLSNFVDKKLKIVR